MSKYIANSFLMAIRRMTPEKRSKSPAKDIRKLKNGIYFIMNVTIPFIHFYNQAFEKLIL
ncbi:MAG: hypothetical protein PUE71_04275 [Clostridia bacterium]|nr:hypothetical protein [Clostridia bacterium]